MGVLCQVHRIYSAIHGQAIYIHYVGGCEVVASQILGLGEAVIVLLEMVLRAGLKVVIHDVARRVGPGLLYERSGDHVGREKGLKASVGETEPVEVLRVRVGSGGG